MGTGRTVTPAPELAADAAVRASEETIEAFEEATVETLEMAEESEDISEDAEIEMELPAMAALSLADIACTLLTEATLAKEAETSGP